MVKNSNQTHKRRSERLLETQQKASDEHKSGEKQVVVNGNDDSSEIKRFIAFAGMKDDNSEIAKDTGSTPNLKSVKNAEKSMPKGLNGANKPEITTMSNNERTSMLPSGVSSEPDKNDQGTVPNLEKIKENPFTRKLPFTEHKIKPEYSGKGKGGSKESTVFINDVEKKVQEILNRRNASFKAQNEGTERKGTVRYEKKHVEILQNVIATSDSDPTFTSEVKKNLKKTGRKFFKVRYYKPLKLYPSEQIQVDPIKMSLKVVNEEPLILDEKLNNKKPGNNNKRRPGRPPVKRFYSSINKEKLVEDVSSQVAYLAQKMHDSRFESIIDKKLIDESLQSVFSATITDNFIDRILASGSGTPNLRLIKDMFPTSATSRDRLNIYSFIAFIACCLQDDKIYTNRRRYKVVRVKYCFEAITKQIDRYDIYNSFIAMKRQDINNEIYFCFAAHDMLEKFNYNRGGAGSSELPGFIGSNEYTRSLIIKLYRYLSEFRDTGKMIKLEMGLPFSYIVKSLARKLGLNIFSDI